MKKHALRITIIALLLFPGLRPAPTAWSADAGAAAMTKADLVEEAKASITQIGVEQARALFVQGGHHFLDAREPCEYCAGHVPGAVNLPRGLLEFRIEKLIPDRDARIVVYCRSGGRSALCAQALRRMGYTRVMSLDGGWRAWQANCPTLAETPCMTKADLVEEAEATITRINVEQARLLFDQGGHRFLDAREPSEFGAGHVPGATNMPRGLLEFRIEKLVPDREASIVVYCRSGGRSALCAQTLRRMGYTRVMSLDGGWRAWNTADCPIEAETARMPATTLVAAAATHGAAMTKADLVKEAKAHVAHIGVEQAKSLFDRGGYYFLDTREPREYRTGHVPGAVNMPRGWIEFRIEDLVPDHDAGIVVYCRSGDRSALAVQTLLRMGYARAVNLDGGWRAWDRANYPVE